MAAPSVTPYASASLYVGDLVNDVTEALLFENFNAVGPVASVRVCRDAATRRSLGYAYVNFHRVEDAERALDTMNFKPIRNKPCRIMWSHRDPSLRKSGLGNIFVKNLAPTIDNKTLYDTFSMFGNILSCKVACKPNGESLKYGFVHYEGEESANQAIARVDGKIIAGDTVIVSAFKSRKERGGQGKFRFTNVYIRDIPLGLPKDKLKEMFDQFGSITSMMISDKSHAKSDGTSKGFGFINFSEPEEAEAACEQMNGKELAAGEKLFVVRAQKKEEREKFLNSRFEQLKVKQRDLYAGVNLYVKNLSDQIDNTRLRDEFAKYGAITSAHVMRDTLDKSRGFGFVCFASPDEATKAVTAMNTGMLDGKPLYVALAQRKDVRRQQLEQQYQARVNVGVKGPMSGQPQLFPGQLGYYPPPMPQQRFYQPAQMMRQWNPAQGGPGGMMPPPHLGVNYQLMALGPGGRGGGGRGNQLVAGCRPETK
jgi:polyadenylate-binding protein